MSDKITGIPRPKGFMRWLARLPIFMARAGLARLLGNRFLVLTHTGRITGLPRQVALEVVRHDKSSDTYFVASGWGEESDWYRNLLKTPQVGIHAGGRRLGAVAERLQEKDAIREFKIYGERYPTALKSLSKIMGYPFDGTEESYRDLGRVIPVISLRVTGENEA
jgi:deazaflavin-dependent oxidoreductase (nitroreductase family)